METRTSEAQTINLPKFPIASTLEGWKTEITDMLVAAAGRRDTLVIEWLNMADSDADDNMLKIVPDCFTSLNSKMTVAIRAITRTADNDYSSEMDLLQDKKISSVLLYLRKLYKYLRVSDDNLLTKAMSNFKSVTLQKRGQHRTVHCTNEEGDQRNEEVRL